MADLKTGTTIGGTLVWTQGNFPLYPTGDTLLYKNFVIYSENNKPQADDNDFVSKAKGGTYLNLVEFQKGLKIGYPSGNMIGSFMPGNGDNATQAMCNVDIKSHWGLGISAYSSTARQIWIDARNGNIETVGLGTFGRGVVSNLAPTLPSHLTRKDYVDGQINTVTNNANSRVLRSGDSMTGVLTAPNFISTNLATASNHVPQLSQVVQRGIVLDYGTY